MFLVRSQNAALCLVMMLGIACTRDADAPGLPTDTPGAIPGFASSAGSGVAAGNSSAPPPNAPSAGIGVVSPTAGVGAPLPQPVPPVVAGQSANAGAGAAPMAAMPRAGSPAVSQPPVVRATWARCGSFECASLDVPLDYAAVGGQTIRLALKRRPASGARMGALLINPGGPGGSAIDFLNTFAGRASAALRDHFDIVAFDPRGVGASAPLNCHSSLQKLIAADPSPDTDAEWTAIDAAAARFAAECAQKHAALLPYLSTRDVARDMDMVRAALGEEQLNYLGFSYGTELGARYAELFPERVRRFVLDGALDLKLTALEIALQQAQGFEQALTTFLTWCGSAANNCPWSASSSATNAFTQLAAALDKQPLAAGQADRPLGPGEFALGVIAPLYGGTQGYRTLSTALRAAASGDGTALLSLADQYLERRQDGSYGNIQEANNAVNCLDLPVPSVDELRSQAMQFATASPRFGLTTLTGLLVCAHWPVRGTQWPAPTAAGAAPIIVIGTTGDPATPYAWAQGLAAELASGVLLTYEGEGHTAYGRGVACIDSAVDAYLVDGKVPAAGTRCARTQAQASMIEAAAMIVRRR